MIGLNEPLAVGEDIIDALEHDGGKTCAFFVA